MSKFVSVFVLLMIAIMAVGAAAELSTDETILGYIDDFNKNVYMYCNMVNARYGDMLGADVSYDPVKLDFLDSLGETFLVDMDGITAELNYGMNVVSARATLMGGDGDAMNGLVRASAIMAMLCYEPPGSFDELKDVYLDTTDSILGGMETCFKEAISNPNKCVSWPCEGPVRPWTFNYYYDGECLYFSTSDSVW